MTRARAALLFLLLATGLTVTDSAFGAEPRQVKAAQVVLFIVDRVSFEELMAVPEFRALARTGGSALMSTKTGPGDRVIESYATIGNGTRSDLNLGSSLLERALKNSGETEIGLLPLNTCTLGRVDSRGRSYASLIASGFLNCALLRTERPDPSSPGGLRTDEDIIIRAVESYSRMDLSGAPDRRLTVVHLADSFRADLEEATRSTRAAVFRSAGQIVREATERLPNKPTLVMVVAPSPSREMNEIGDEVTPLLLAVGMPSSLFGGAAGIRSLRSDTTRQTGLVSNVDVAPTILEFFGISIPSEMDGQPIEMTDEPAPFNLHRRHLEQRRIRLPVQLAEVSFVSASGAVAIAVLLVASRRRSIPPRLGAAMAFLTLCVAAMPIPLLLGGVLPRLTYAVVVPFIALSVLGLAALARSARWSGPVRPFVFLGMVGLSVVVVDGLFGWRGARIPLLGGTMFDGARFFGLPNAFLGLLLASALFVAAALPAFTGFLVLVGAGLFAGFPSLGADIGGAATVLFAAGLWWVLRTRWRFGVKEAAFVAGVVALGVGAVLLANRYLPGTPTHATRFVETTGNSLGDAVRAYGDRMTVGFEQLRDAPAAWIPLLGLPVILALVLARPGYVGWGLERAGRRWTQVLVVLTLAGVVAFFANDTGLAAAAPVFLYAFSGMAYPAFLAATERRGTDRPVESPR